MRKLFTALLVLPFLLGANAPAAVPVMPPIDAAAAAPAAATGLSGITEVAPHTPLPAQVSGISFAAGTALLEGPDSGRWRVQTGSGGHSADPLQLSDPARSALVRIALLRQRQLEFRVTMARASTGRPATHSQPPPASLT